MATRVLYAVRHGSADALGSLTEASRQQCRHLGRQRARLPIDVVWHSPLPRAADSAAVLADQLSARPSGTGQTGAEATRTVRGGSVRGGSVLVDEAAELIDHVPHVPSRASLSGSNWAGCCDGCGPAALGRCHEAA